MTTIYITPENYTYFLNIDGKTISKRFTNYSISPEHYWCKTKGEALWCCRNNIRTPILCKECNSNTKYLSPGQGGYQLFCSVKCSNKNIDKLKTQAEATDYVTRGQLASEAYQLKSSIDKTDYIMNSKKKREATCLVKYGDKTFNNRVKFKDTNIERYGVEHPMQNKTISNKVMATQTTKYGGLFHPAKVKATNNDKYGADYPLQNKAVALKFSKQLRIKYNDGKHGAGVVYIIYSPQLNLVKIGYSSNFNNRSKILKRNYGDFDVISVVNYDDAYKEELILHQKFDAYNILLSEGTGKTEWFHSDILKLL